MNAIRRQLAIGAIILFHLYLAIAIRLDRELVEEYAKEMEENAAAKDESVVRCDGGNGP
jgi:DMSO/TMAO reductase YedYZ heme-binding membrane subunit